jgi:hypothetical protein
MAFMSKSGVYGLSRVSSIGSLKRLKRAFFEYKYAIFLSIKALN